jgi:hypothetical protein
VVRCARGGVGHRHSSRGLTGPLLQLLPRPLARPILPRPLLLPVQVGLGLLPVQVGLGLLPVPVELVAVPVLVRVPVLSYNYYHDHWLVLFCLVLCSCQYR